ncbi:MAG: acetylglutamate kinase [Leptospiraceae bacterium]|nr:acetylglutamate kinase [Leptospiraceae bacterium]MCZ8345383.1 acetylglutamate kinase [Leptospiraceae bacterium]
METREILTKLLEVTEDQKDGLQYLEFFKSLEPWRFALVYPTPDSIIESWDALFYQLRILFKLGLYPVVLLHSSMPYYAKTFFQNFQSEESHKLEVPFQWIRKQEAILQKIQQAISKKRIPVILTKDKDDTIFSIIQELISTLDSNKLIVLNPRSGIRKKQDSTRFSIINLQTDYPKLISKSLVDEEDLPLLKNISKVVQFVQKSRFTASVTSPVYLLKELFTVKGSGTLIRRGSFLTKHINFQSLDKERLGSLIETSFRKSLKTSFLDKNQFDSILLEDDYKACALFIQWKDGVLLSKFAVDEIARGEGIGRDIWDMMKELYPKIIWRAKKSNSINSWYAKESDGHWKAKDWYYYWIGIKATEVVEVIEFLSSLEEDLEVIT